MPSTKQPLLTREAFRALAFAAIRRLAEDLVACGEEGLMIRTAGAFGYREFKESVAKNVRAGHVRTDRHWMQGEVVTNRLARRD